MKFKRPRRKVEMLSAPGLLRVTITPQFSVILVAVAAMGIAMCVVVWTTTPAPTYQRAILCGLIGVFVSSLIWNELKGSEEIEFSRDRFAVRRTRPLSPKMFEFPLTACMQMELHSPGEGESEKLRCSVRGDRVTFGEDLTEDQAINILVELQRALPNEADHLFASRDIAPFGKHFTTLKLN